MLISAVNLDHKSRLGLLVRQSTNTETFCSFKRSAEKMLGNMRLTGNIPCIPSRIKNIPGKVSKNTYHENNDEGGDDSVFNNEQRIAEHSFESNVRTSITSNIPLEYEVAFHKAVATFKHQTIFDLKTRKVRWCDCRFYVWCRVEWYCVL